MKSSSLASIILFLAACATTSRTTPDASTARAVALELLERGARSWNRGDLDGFMADYVDGPRTAFVVLKDHSS